MHFINFSVKCKLTCVYISSFMMKYPSAQKIIFRIFFYLLLNMPNVSRFFLVEDFYTHSNPILSI